jgi:hypothetical protein
MREGEARLKVMRKDLILNKRLIFVNALIFLACLGFFAHASEQTPPRVYAGFAGFMMAFLPSILITREDKFNAMTLGCSLPVSRKTIVQARFLLSLGMSLVGIGGAFLFAVLIPGSRYTFGDLFSWGPFITALTVITLVLSFLFSFTFRYGMKGLFIFLIAAQVLGVILLTLAQVTRSNLDKIIVGWIAGGFLQIHDFAGPVGFRLIMVGLILSILFAAYRVSIRVFERREL